MGRPIRVTVLEASDQIGGNIKTIREEGFTVEQGPNGFLGRRRALRRLIEELGLGSELVQASPDGARRYLARGDGLIELPKGPLDLLKSDLLLCCIA